MLAFAKAHFPTKHRWTRRIVLRSTSADPVTF